MDKATRVEKDGDQTLARPQSLLRQEVLDAHGSLWLGAIRLAQPASAWLVAGFAAFIACCLVAFLTLFSVTKKARASGVTVPLGGSLSIVAPNAGVLVRTPVKEGEHVDAEQPLFELSTERQGTAGEITALVSQQLAVRKFALEAEQRARLAQDQEKRLVLDQRLGNLDVQATQFEEELALAQRRHELAQKSVEKYDLLQKNGFVSPVQSQQKMEELIDLSTRLSSLGREKSQLQAGRLAIEAERKALASTLVIDMAQLSRAEASLNQESAENQNRKTSFITAPEAGILTTMTYQTGQAVNSGQVLATLIPDGAGKPGSSSELEAHLYAPSRASGFVAPGQAVLIRYQSFPYQKYGLQEGVVTDISKTPFAPNELPANLAGTILSYSQPQGNESLYRVKVKLVRQSIKVQGQEQALKPGMTLDADIIQDRRKVWEWIAEPLLAVTRR